MKKFVFLFVLLACEISQASYECQTSEGDLVKIFTGSPLGTGTKVVSKKITDYYLQHFNVEIPSLESIIDPETQKFDSQQTATGYLFGLQAEKQIVESMWSLDIAFTSKKAAEAVVTDLEGTQFEFKLTCEQTADL